MSRGGKRAGTPGKTYGNRSDLNKPASADVYGDRVARERRMEAVPLQRAAPPTPQGMQGPAAPMPFDRPSERPMEPVTAGLPTGAGPGPEVLGLRDGPADELRAIYLATGSEAIRELIEAMEEGR